jgi:hypothetical protein
MDKSEDVHVSRQRVQWQLQNERLRIENDSDSCKFTFASQEKAPLHARSIEFVLGVLMMIGSLLVAVIVFFLIGEFFGNAEDPRYDGRAPDDYRISI